MIDKFAGHSFNVAGAVVAQLAALVALPDAPASIAVTDSAANIANDLLSGNSALAADLGTISTITVTHGTLALTDAQAETILNAAPLNAVFTKLAPSTTVAITGAPVVDLAGLSSSTWPHVTVAVTDSAAAIAADLNSGNSSLMANAAILTGVTLSAGGVFNAATLTEMTALPALNTNGFNLGAADNAVAILGLSATTLGFVHGVSVSDTAANVAFELDALQAKHLGGLSITLTDSSPAFTIGAVQYVQDQSTVDAITNPGAVTVVGGAATLTPLAAALGADTRIAAVDITDSASNVVANLASLQAAGSKLVVMLTDTSLSASVVAPLLALGVLSNSNIPVVDTGAQIAAVVESGNTQAIAYLNSHGALLNGNSAVSATDAAALETLSSLNLNGHALSVWDTASHLTSPAYAAAIGSNEISAVYLKTTGGAVNVTAATAAALFNLPGFSTTNPDSTPNALNVVDTAAHIEAALGALTANRPQIGAITVNAAATISDQTLADLQGLGAGAAPQALITVRDTAATIANNATVQGSGHTIEPAGWTLSANGSVSETQAVLLGTLANFSAGPYSISLSLPSNTFISLADANALGNIAGALTFPGAHPIVAGSAGVLATLTPAALGLVTPALIDTAAHIAALPINSPLLAGTVEVIGTEALTASTASALLALVHTGAGPGITAANLTFDSTHPVTDTVANLHALTTSAGWTSNAGVHGDFTLAARDSAANLTNPASTGFLAGLTQTGLTGPSTVTAAIANSLSTLGSTIHFVHDTAITVQDSAAALLNPANSAGLGLADSVTLSGPTSVDAADAESLLGLSHFTLNSPLLTITDSSANLLDGVLGNAITSHGFAADIVVQLAGPETLDADTAEALVSLPGFADTTNLTIANSSSYLLNTANLSAEQMAASVTLAGDETVSANTVLRLAQIPHFTPGSSHLVLANNDFANAATLHAIADDGAAFQSNGHMLTLTQDALDLTPTEFAALQSDLINTSGHLIGITPTPVSITDTGGMLTVQATGIAGGIVHVYAQDGSVVSTPAPNAGFTVTAADTAPGHNFAITESVGGVEGAPLVILDAASLETAASLANATFSSTGQIQIEPGKFVNLYEAGSVPALAHPALVYDPVAHTVSLDLPSGAPVTLITLGGTTHPASLDLSEIVIKHHG